MLYRFMSCGSGLLIGPTAMLACDRIPAPAAPARPPATVAVHATLQSPPQPAFEGVSWGSRAESRTAASITGNPVIMASGARCSKYRSLPAAEFYRNTLIQDACLELPSNTIIMVQGGVTLGIVATHGLRIGKNVRFDAMGTQGIRGRRADFQAVTLTPDTDAQIHATCVENGNRCSCPVGNASATAIRGHGGGAGSPGGRVRLIIGRLVSPEQLVGLNFDVTGGRGGPAGESGRQDCIRGNIKCSSDSCSDGATDGIRGVDGSIHIALGGSSKTDKLLGVLGRSCVPSDATTVVPLASEVELQTEVRALNDMAYQNDWDRRSGQRSY